MSQRRNAQQNNALIIFTREPVPGKTKTRLMPYFTGEECAELHKRFLMDYAAEMQSMNLIICYTGGEPCEIRAAFGEGPTYVEQEGETLGARMNKAIKDAFVTYDKVVLVGTDIPELKASTINKAFSELDEADVVIGPTTDGGYYLIGMKAPCDAAFDVKKYGGASVFEETIASIEASGAKVATVDTYSDIDEPVDVQGYRKRMRSDKRLQKSHTGRYLASKLRVSIVIPIYNEEKTIAKMLEQMRPYKDDAEIMFVDGGSKDRTVEIIGDEFTVIHSEKGRANQMNNGAKASTGDVIFFLHCDSTLPPDIITEIRNCMVGNAYGCFGVKFNSKHFFMWTNEHISNHRAWKRGLPFGDQGIFIDRELFFEVGMFPVLPIMEDYEFGRRLAALGIKPGKTHGRITTSSRRYGKSTLDIMKTEYKMWNLRRLYRRGTDIERISELYRDIR